MRLIDNLSPTASAPVETARDGAREARLVVSSMRGEVTRLKALRAVASTSLQPRRRSLLALHL